MRSSDLLSKEWCDLVFDGRNKAYGAYRLRAQAGLRYRRAMEVVLGSFLALMLFHGAMSIYSHYMTARNMKEAEDAFAQMRASDLKEGYKVKFVATARMAPPVRMAPGAVQGPPVIVDGVPAIKRIGFDGPIVFDPDQDAITTPIVDTTGLSDPTLPIARQKIVPTEVVSQMPNFPGGPRAFMQWLNDNIVYPQQCVSHKRQGLVTITFIVGTDGYPIDFEVKNAFDPLIFRTAMNALKRMPRWRPGTDEDGKVTPVRITVPVEFKI